MSLSENEIMGGISYGNDAQAPEIDLRAMLSAYNPIQQEPMGRSYRPEIGRSYYEYPAWDASNPVSGIAWEPRTPYPVTAFPPENAFQTAMQSQGSFRDITKTVGQEAGANSNLADTIDLMSRSKQTERSSVVRDRNLQNDFGIGDLFSAKTRESMAGFRDSVLGNNSIVLIILMFILFIIVAYLQHQNIQRLQDMIEKIIDKK